MWKYVIYREYTYTAYYNRCLAGRMAMHTCQIGPTDTAPPCPGSPQWAALRDKGGTAYYSRSSNNNNDNNRTRVLANEWATISIWRRWIGVFVSIYSKMSRFNFHLWAVKRNFSCRHFPSGIPSQCRVRRNFAVAGKERRCKWTFDECTVSPTCL